jgi:hypothetical protein
MDYSAMAFKAATTFVLSVISVSNHAMWNLEVLNFKKNR